MIQSTANILELLDRLGKTQRKKTTSCFVLKFVEFPHVSFLMFDINFTMKNALTNSRTKNPIVVSHAWVSVIRFRPISGYLRSIKNIHYLEIFLVNKRTIFSRVLVLGRGQSA